MKCDRARFVGWCGQGCFSSEVPSFKSAPTKIPANVLKRSSIEPSRDHARRIALYPLLARSSSSMRRAPRWLLRWSPPRLRRGVRTSLRTAISKSNDTLIPRKTLAELTKLTAGFGTEDISLGGRESHLFRNRSSFTHFHECCMASFRITKW